jgi:hypothetical protein
MGGFCTNSSYASISFFPRGDSGGEKVVRRLGNLRGRGGGIPL